MSSDNENNVETSSNTANISSGVLGSVKWFNNRVGYGFITATGEHSNYGDVFVHHSELKIVDADVYKYLVQGEYVQFNIVKPENGKYEYQAVSVTGVNGGKLMCENQHTIERLQRTSHRGQPRTFRPRNKEQSEEQEQEQTSNATPRQSYRPRSEQQEKSYRPRREQQEQSHKPRNEQLQDGFQFPKGRKPREQPPAETPYKNTLKKNIPTTTK